MVSSRVYIAPLFWNSSYIHPLKTLFYVLFLHDVFRNVYLLFKYVHLIVLCFIIFHLIFQSKLYVDIHFFLCIHHLQNKKSTRTSLMKRYSTFLFFMRRIMSHAFQTYLHDHEIIPFFQNNSIKLHMNQLSTLKVINLIGLCC